MATPTESLALLGSAPGLSIVGTQTVLSRPHYFDGRFLRADDLRAEQAYTRALAALSGQALGSGVAYGFDVEQASGDGLRLHPGLALAPSGRAVHLPEAHVVPVSQLIERSEAAAAPSASPAGGTAAFGPCPPASPEAPAVTSQSTAVYLITVSPAEALCGQQEQFGHLCEDACVTDTEHSTVVEGVRVRVRRIDLSGLPTSSSVTFTGTHLRSRVAAAFFAGDRKSLPSLVSGPGLTSGAWCRGAQPVGADRAAYGMGPDEVAVGLMGRSGQVTTFLDQWTARREITEPPAKRWWAWRMAMRPWDVFLAQVLQFQCQLAGVADGGPLFPPGGSCEPERSALQEASDVLAQLQAGGTGERSQLTGGTIDWQHLVAVAHTIDQVLASGGQTAPGGVLLHRGIVELPPAGYLPVDPSGAVEEQVRAFVGSGVDLRFCVVRSDFVGEALQEAQHLERISLTAGLDDPAARPRVDVLVPDGRAEHTATGPGGAGFEAEVTVAPEHDNVAAAFGGVARAAPAGNGGIELLFAGRGAVPDETAGQRLVDALRHPLSEDEGLASLRRAPLTEHRDAARAAREAFARVATEAAEFNRRMRTAARPAADTFRGVTPGPNPRPDFAWVDARIDGDPFAATTVGGHVPLHAELIVSFPAAQPTYARLVLDGRLEVSGAAGSNGVVGRVVGTAALLLVVGGDAQPRPIPAIDVPIRLELVSAGTSAVLRGEVEVVTGGHGEEVIVGFEVTASGTPLRIEGSAWAERRRQEHVERVDLARARLDESEAVFVEGNPTRSSAQEAIEVIAATLADPAFATEARSRLLDPGAQGGAVSRLQATRDWVFFHRRRDKVCVGDAPPAPPRPAPGPERVAVLHAAASDADDVARIRETLLAASVTGVSLTEVVRVEFAADTATMLTGSPTVRGAVASAVGARRVVGAVAAGAQGHVATQRLHAIRVAASGVLDPQEWSETVDVAPAALGLGNVETALIFVTAPVTTVCHQVRAYFSDNDDEAVGRLQDGVEAWLRASGQAELDVFLERQGFGLREEREEFAFVAGTDEEADPPDDRPQLAASGWIVVVGDPDRSEPEDVLTELQGPAIAQALELDLADPPQVLPIDHSLPIDCEHLTFALTFG